MFTRRSWILLAVAVAFLLAGLLLQRLAEGEGESAPEVPDSELTPAATSPNGSLPAMDATFQATVVAAIQTIAAQTAEVTTPNSGSSSSGNPSSLATLVAKFTTPNPTIAGRRDLSLDEARGGHTLARHVGKTDDELRARLKAEPDISAASTYTDRATAERVVAEVLVKQQSDLQKWEARTGSRPNLALRLDLGETIGRSIQQGKTKAVNADSALVVLRWDGSGWYVLTSYPE